MTLSNIVLLSISGQDAKKFLQGQLTCDLEEISSTQTRIGAHCNPQGRIISLFRICWYQDQYLLQMPGELLPIAIHALKKYAQFFKVKMTELTLTKLNYCGKSLDFFPKKVDEAVFINNLLIYEIPGENCFEIIGEAQALMELEKKLEGEIVSENKWHEMKIATGIPTLYPETSEKFLPHELNLPRLNAVSFKKGCYTGQEIIARMEYRGKVKTQLARARVTTPDLPSRGKDIYCEKEPCGTIVDYASLGYNNYELLALVSEKIRLTMHGSLDPDNKFPLQFLGG